MMNRYDIERIYQENGLNNCKLTCLKDLKNCHGIDAEKVKGYKELTEEHKEIFKIFIINYFNGQGMDLRMTTIPKSINLIKENRGEYLRFEFKEGKRNIWLHVTHGGKEWY